MMNLLMFCVSVFTVVLRQVGGQPIYDVTTSNTSENYARNIFPSFSSTILNKFKVERGWSAAPVDIDHYNMLIDADPNCSVNKIEDSVTAAYLIYIHRGFHAGFLFHSMCQEWGKWTEVSSRLDNVVRDLVKMFSIEGYSNVLMQYNRLSYPDGTFNSACAMASAEDVNYLKRLGKYYDAVKLGVSTHQFQLIEPSQHMKSQWVVKELKPVCLHRVFGGWFQFAAVLFVSMPGNSNQRWYVWDGPPTKFVSEKDGRYHLLARALEDGVNDAWRDYPENAGSGIRYDIRSYTWEKTGVTCRMEDPPFVTLTRIANAFNDFFFPAKKRMRTSTDENEKDSGVTKETTTATPGTSALPQDQGTSSMQGQLKDCAVTASSHLQSYMELVRTTTNVGTSTQSSHACNSSIAESPYEGSLNLSTPSHATV